MALDARPERLLHAPQKPFIERRLADLVAERELLRQFVRARIVDRQRTRHRKPQRRMRDAIDDPEQRHAAKRQKRRKPSAPGALRLAVADRAQWVDSFGMPSRGM